MSALPPLRSVGRPYPRVDGVAKVTGRAAYTSDLHVPGMLRCGIVRSLEAHAALRSVNCEAARAVPGVVAVLSARDLLGIVRSNRFGPVVKDAPLLAEEVVRYEGEPVALVVGRDRAAVERGVAAVEVEYERRPVLEDVVDALREDAPRLHREAEQGQFGGRWGEGWEPARNIAGQYHDRRGDVDAALARADHLFSHEYVLPPVHHYTLENHAALALPEAGGMTVRSGNQYPFLMVAMLAELLGLPQSAVRVEVPAVGAGFGSREYVNVLPLAAVAARATGQPVLLETRVDESFHTASRHGAVVRITSGVTAGGLITARRVELLFDTGAYADQGPRVVRQAGYRSPGPYRIPNVAVDAYAVYTNKVPAGAYRGFGASQPIFGCERHMDEIARAIGLDPVEFRMRNLLDRGDDFVEGDLPLDCDLPEALRIAVDRVGGLGAQTREDGRLEGVGVAVGVKNTASGRLPSTAIVRIHMDGSATVLSSSVELGQGAHTLLTQLAAEALGCEPGRVRLAGPDTALSPFDQRTSSSRTSVQMGSAVVRAAEDAKRQLLEAAARILDCNVALLALCDGRIGGGPRELSCRDVLNAPGSRFGGEVIGVGHFQPEQPEAPTAFGMRAAYWEGSVGAARVAIDPGTGAIEVLRFVTVADAGRVVNPLTAHGQEEGGAAMAIGHALFEAMEFEEGRLLNPSPIDYRFPLATDIPADLESVLIERGDGPGPYGIKGLGESSIITAAPAVANAVAMAIGAPLRELPLTPWRVLAALAGAKAGGGE